MKLLVDTTYVLPAIGVAIKGFSEKVILDLQKNGHSVSICTISLFELAAKGAKYITEGRLKAEQVLLGLRAVASDENLSKVPYEDGNVLTSAFDLRKGIADFIDCLMLSAAVQNCDAFVTEDLELRRAAGQGIIREVIRELRVDFRVLSAQELLQR